MHLYFVGLLFDPFPLNSILNLVVTNLVGTTSSCHMYWSRFNSSSLILDRLVAYKRRRESLIVVKARLRINWDVLCWRLSHWSCSGAPSCSQAFAKSGKTCMLLIRIRVHVCCPDPYALTHWLRWFTMCAGCLRPGHRGHASRQRGVSDWVVSACCWRL